MYGNMSEPKGIKGGRLFLQKRIGCSGSKKTFNSIGANFIHYISNSDNLVLSHIIFSQASRGKGIGG